MAQSMMIVSQFMLVLVGEKRQQELPNELLTPTTGESKDQKKAKKRVPNVS